MRTDGTFIVLSVAGSDPTGGAGIQGDLRTFATHRVVGTAVVAALTAQNHAGVRFVDPVPPAVVRAQLEALLEQVDPHAAKTGMLHDAGIVDALVGVFARRPPLPLVVDPVLVASAGGSLADPSLPAAILTRLGPLATLLTPNLAEAAVLLGRTVAPSELRDAADALRRRAGGAAVLLKGGHGDGPEATDVLATGDGDVVELRAPRLAVAHGHGTGCALSASIAARLARGEPLGDAVRGAKGWVHRALAAARPLGRGRGPIALDTAID